MPDSSVSDKFPSSDTSFDAVAPYYEHLMSAVPYRFWVGYLERLWREHALPNKRVLDLACGTGTVSRLLAVRGHDVVGVDLAPKMLEIARRKDAEEGTTIEYVNQDAADLLVDGPPFDAVISLFDSLNYILEPDRLAQAFKRIYAHLVVGGALIFDLNTEYAFEEGMFNQSCSRRDEPLHYRWRSRYDVRRRICTVNMSFSFDSGNGERTAFKEVHRQRAYSKSEIAGMLSRAGFAQIAVYDAYSMEPPTPKSDRLFYVAERQLE